MSSEHVDFVYNDWSGGQQRRAGYVHLTPNGVEHVALVPNFPAPPEVLERPDVGVLARRSDGAEYLRLLTFFMNGDYYWATDPHGGADCPFAAAESVPMVVGEWIETERGDGDQVTGVEGEPMSSLFAEGAATERAAIVKFLRSEALNNGHPNLLLVAARRIDEQQHHAH